MVACELVREAHLAAVRQSFRARRARHGRLQPQWQSDLKAWEQSEAGAREDEEERVGGDAVEQEVRPATPEWTCRQAPSSLTHMNGPLAHHMHDGLSPG